MSTTCPHGHASETTDYCDQCGARIDVEFDVEVEVEVEEPATDQITDRPVATDVELCPKCQTPRTGDDRFCEVDGYDFVTGAGLSSPVRWVALVTADREYFDTLAPDGIAFPPSYEPRTFSLDDDEVVIGRRSASRGIEPHIDLGGSPQDEGISHLHAVLIRSDDGSYSLVDRGSTNGTSVNGSTDVIVRDTPVALGDGDRIHLGAWTTITIRRVFQDAGD